MSVLAYEFVLSLRRVFRRPLQSGLMLATFTISIALSLISWSLFYTMFLKQPDFDPQGQLTVVSLIADTPGARRTHITHEDLTTWQERQSVFTELAGFSIYRSIFIATKTSAQRHLGALVSAQALRMVGARPLLGRLFTADEDKLKCAPVILLSQRTWENRFGADPQIVGQVVRVDGFAATIVGVMPAAFHFPNDQEVWLPLGFDNWLTDDPTDNTIEALGRLKPGVTPAQATNELRSILESRGSGTLAARYKLRPVLTPIREYYLFPYMRDSAIVLLALSIVFILVSCANVANLMMIDFFGRSAELATAMSIGLPRAASIRSLCLQVGILVALATALGVGVLVLAAPLVHQSFVLMLTPYWLHFSLAWHHVAMALGLAFVSAGVAVITPIVYLMLVSPERIIRDGAGASRGTGRGPWRAAVLVGQLALLTLLGIAAGLLMQSNRQLREAKWGYDAGRVFLGKLDMPLVDFPEQPKRLTLFRKIVAEVGRLPGVVGVAVTDNPPGYSLPAATRYALDPATLANGREDGRAMTSESTDQIFDAIGVPLVAGSAFPAETKETDAVEVILNAGLSARLWPGRDPLGQTIYLRFPWLKPEEPTVRARVRGVVHDFQASGPQSTNNDLIALPFRGWTPSTLFLMVRGATSLPSAKELNDAVWRVDPRVVPYFPDSVKHQIDMQLGFVRLTTRLTAIYALAAVLLCGVGVYSITVAQILQRNREFGIRLALGIDPLRLWLRFVRTHLITAVVGVLLGAVAAVGAMHALKSLLYGIEERDPVTFVLVAAAILTVATLASVPSLFRLLRVNPADCLRSF